VPAMEVGISEVSQNLRACKAFLPGLLYVQEQAVHAMGLGSVRLPKTFAPARRSYRCEWFLIAALSELVMRAVTKRLVITVFATA
jgi:hypothetical protein